ncbi:MAG: recombinase family protein [Bacillota bacterium]
MRRRAPAKRRYQRAAIYLRVSSEDQARHGYSLGEQEERCRQLAADLGAGQVVLYTDGGESGSRLDRPGLGALREALQAGLHDLVVVLDPDRLARNLYLQLALHDEFRRLGVALEFVNLDWEDTPDGRLFLQMRGAIAEYEREKIRMRTYAGRRRKARQGGLPCGPVDAYGYRYDREAQQLRPDPGQAATVREIFRWAAYGDPALFPEGPPGPARIARALNQLGIPTARGTPAGWRANTVRQLLRNRRYIGELVTFRTTAERGRRRPAPESERITVPVPPLVDPATFAQANANLTANGRRQQGRPRHPYLLAGLLRCGLCGRPLHGSLQRLRRRTRPQAVPYYACSGRPACRLPLQPALPLEDLAWRAVKELLAGQELAPAPPGPPARTTFLQRLRQEQEAQRLRLATAFRLGGLTEAEYRAELEALQRAAQETSRQLEEQGSVRPAPAPRLEALPHAARRALCALAIERATLLPGRLTLRLRTGPREGMGTPSPLR